MISNNIKVYAKKNWSDTEYTELDVATIVNLRKEAKGLGAGQITINLPNYVSEDKDLYTGQRIVINSELISYINYWIFVVDTNEIADPEKDENGNEIPYSFKPWNDEVFWWGFVGDENYEIQQNTHYKKGSLGCYEFGHFVGKNKISYYEYVNNNGYNPILNGIAIGNKDPGSPISGYNSYHLMKNGKNCSKNPTKDSSTYFTVKEVIGSLCFFSLENDIQLIPIFPSTSSDFLNGFETIPSYVGNSLNSALDEILDSFTWYYSITKDNTININFKDISIISDTFFELDETVESVFVLNEEQAYDKVILKGDRIEFFGSISTYNVLSTVGAQKNWTDAELGGYLEPISGSNGIKSNQNIDDFEASTFYKYSQTANTILTSEQDSSLRNERENALGLYEEARRAYKNVYRNFSFGYCNINNPSVSGSCLATYAKPGDYSYIADYGEAVSKIIPFFPNVLIQSGTALDDAFIFEESTGLWVAKKKVVDTINLIPTIQDGTHRTPAATEMEFITSLASDDDNNVLYEPKFFYRTLGRNQKFTTGLYPCPLWVDGTRSGKGLMSSTLKLDYDGIYIDAPVPESFACPLPDIFYDLDDNGEYQNVIRDWNVTRTEWRDISTCGATPFDPSRRGKTYRHKGHWSRLVFSLGMKSEQRIEAEFGHDGDRILTINDDFYKMTIIRKGYVTNTTSKMNAQYSDSSELQQGSTTLNWATSDKIIRNDLQKLANRLQVLWDYYSRLKRQVKITGALFTPHGNVNYYPIEIGDSFSYFIDSDKKSYDLNSYIASIEYDFTLTTPRIMITTEYPSGPSATRNRVVNASNKERK